MSVTVTMVTCMFIREQGGAEQSLCVLMMMRGMGTKAVVDA